MLSQHIKYPKIKRLGDEDTDGILLGKVYVQEKVDGANTSIWLDEDGKLKCGTRTRIVDEGFNGFPDYVKAHEGIQKYLADHPTHRLYGEWLVRHTIAYNETAYKQFYLFDILDVSDTFEAEQDDEDVDRQIVRGSKWLTIEEVNQTAKDYGINHVPLFGTFENPSPDQLQEFVGKTEYGDKGEGIVIKNPEFINKWGDRACAKMVAKEFMEENAVVFGGNNKYSKVYHEMYVVNKYMTLARVQKIMNKIQPTIDRRLGMEHTAQIMGMAYHDMFEEEMWGVAKKHPIINFKDLQRLATKKAVRIYHDILNNHLSVAYDQKSSDQKDS